VEKQRVAVCGIVLQFEGIEGGGKADGWLLVCVCLRAIYRPTLHRRNPKYAKRNNTRACVYKCMFMCM